MNALEKDSNSWVAAEREWNDSSNWRGGILGIYYAPDDRRVLVRKRWYPGGWTFNFARPASWFWLGAILVFAAVMLLFAVPSCAC